MFIYLFSFSYEEVGSTKNWVYESSEETNRICLWQKCQLRKVYMDSSRPMLVNKIIAKSMIYKQCLEALMKSHKDDVLICFDQETGLVLNDMIIRFMLNRKIVIMGWLAPSGNESSDGSYIKRLKRAAQNIRCRNITNYDEGKKRWIELTNPTIDNFRVIHDVVNRDIYGDANNRDLNRGRFCFVGGITNRDWDLSIEIARRFPQMHFIFVSSKVVQDFGDKELPSNIKIIKDIPLDEYYGLLSKAYVCLVPLRTSSPSGLLNIIRASQYRVLCMSSLNPYTDIYYPKNAKWLLNSSFDDWIENLKRIIEMDESEYRSIAVSIGDHVTRHFSTEYGTQELKKIIKEL